eukprot:COSAG01_NODE_6876_length_3457_cov_77.637284_2_plen_74_part_00
MSSRRIDWPNHETANPLDAVIRRFARHTRHNNYPRTRFQPQPMKAHKSDSVATSDQNYSDPALKATCLESHLP